jgi:ABC-type spermidine/putrescine transport system permease subunit I
MIHVILIIIFILVLLLVGLPVGMVIATKHENRYREFFGHWLFLPTCLTSALALYGLASFLSPAFYVLITVPGLGILIQLSLFKAGRL